MEKIEITFLGTGSAVPLPNRMHPGIHIKYAGYRFLWDCGEGTQVQIRKAKLSPLKISHIFITHWHGDHFFGLPGLIQSMNLDGREKPLVVFGPKGVDEFMPKILGLGYYEKNYEIEYWEAKPGVVWETDEFKISAFRVDHGTPAVGYVFQEKNRRRIVKEKIEKLGVPQGPLWGELQRGNEIEWNGRIVYPDQVTVEIPGRKIVYTGDTRPCESIVKASKDADILIHDSTFSNDLLERAKETMHSTAIEAGRIAREANVKQLVLTGFSKRYKDEDLVKLWDEAKKEFDNVVVARDLEKIEL